MKSKTIYSGVGIRTTRGVFGMTLVLWGVAFNSLIPFYSHTHDLSLANTRPS